MAPTRWLPLLLAWTLLIQSLAPALASPRPLCAKTPTQSTTHVPSANHAHHQYLVDTSQPYAEVIQEAEWMNNALPLITRYDIGLDRLRMFKYQVTSNGPPPVFSPVLSGWYLFDGLGSTRALVDDSGAGTDLWGYQDAFGIPNRLFPATGGTANSFFLNGQQFDNYEGLYFNRARYYQPGLGRFIGKDP
ncbi:RHS repeat domain-containing protein, partial [Armatimonas sp.]|uniref:RHS repeat domain-containing protein n=1 Tax=Armatimonas sp. TaxID=1872638 RepID=UPI00374DD3AB